MYFQISLLGFSNVAICHDHITQYRDWPIEVKQNGELNFKYPPFIAEIFHGTGILVLDMQLSMDQGIKMNARDIALVCEEVAQEQRERNWQEIFSGDKPLYLRGSPYREPSVVVCSDEAEIDGLPMALPEHKRGFFDLPPNYDFYSDAQPVHLHFDDMECIWNILNGIQTLDADTVECYYQGDFIGRWVFADLEEGYYSGRMTREEVLGVLRTHALHGTRKSFYTAQAKRLGLIS